jgi:hypothetical protein
MSVATPCTRDARTLWIVSCHEYSAWRLPLQIGRRDQCTSARGRMSCSALPS